MTKKLLTLAVATAFTGSALADVTISGSSEWSHSNNNGATETALDATVSIKATTELSNGMTASADFNIDEEAGNDGGNSLTVAGSFGSLDMGDTSSAVDAIDDAAAWGYVLAQGSSTADHAVLYTLPEVVSGLTVRASYAADTNQDSNAGGSSVSATYKVADLATVGYGIIDNDDNTEETLYNVKTSIKGVTLGYEVHTDTNASNVDTDKTSMSVAYTAGDITVAYANNETESTGSVSENIDTYGVHYKVASELTAFVETQDDAEDATAKKTVVGFAYKF